MFGTKESKGTKGGGTKSPKGGKKKKNDDANKISVLPGKRGYNIEIFLGRIKLNPYDLRTWILNLDERKLDSERVSQLIKFTPTPEESQLYEGYDNENNFTKADNYFNIMRTIDNNVPQRLELWYFKLMFNEKLKDEQDKINYLKKGILCIKSNNSFYINTLFSIVLAMGNYMNAGSNKGNAYGFRLNSLQQLSRSKSVDNTKTMLEFIYEHFEKNNKKFLNIKNDWKPLEQSTKVDLPTLKQGVNMIQAKLNLIKKRIDKETQPKGDKFKQVMTPFYNKAKKDADMLKSSLQNVLKSLTETAKFLGERNDINGEYLKQLLQFYNSFVYMERHIAEKRARKAKQAERERKKQDKLDKKRKSVHQSVPSMKIPSGKGAGDALIGNLMQADKNSFMAKLKKRRMKIKKKNK